MDFNSESEYYHTALQAISSEVVLLKERMDFFESIVIKLLTGLKDAGIIIDEDDNPHSFDDSNLI